MTSESPVRRVLRWLDRHRVLKQQPVALLEDLEGPDPDPDDLHDRAIARCRRVLRWLDRHRVIEQLPVAIALVFVAAGIWRGEQQAAVSSDRDEARKYQRCEQNRPLVVAVNLALDLSPDLLARLTVRVPRSLVDGRLPVPDCAGTYPRGARESYRFPDAAPPQSRSTP